MTGVVRLTTPTRLILNALLEAPDQEHYGRELMKATNLESGTLYPILNRLRSHGWLTDRWETLDEHTAGRPPRRFFQLTETGAHEARAALDPQEKPLMTSRRDPYDVILTSLPPEVSALPEEKK